MKEEPTKHNENAVSTLRKKISKVKVALTLGHSASLREHITSDEKTHDWSFYVRGDQGAKIDSYIEKIIFKLHESFTNPVQVLTKPPYEINEQGYGTFIMQVEVRFRNKREPKNINYKYDLLLPGKGIPPIQRSRKEILTFTNPNADFMGKLIDGGGTVHHYDIAGNLISKSTPRTAPPAPEQTPRPSKQIPDNKNRDEDEEEKQRLAKKKRKERRAAEQDAMRLDHKKKSSRPPSASSGEQQQEKVPEKKAKRNKVVSSSAEDEESDGGETVKVKREEPTVSSSKEKKSNKNKPTHESEQEPASENKKIKEESHSDRGEKKHKKSKPSSSQEHKTVEKKSVPVEERRISSVLKSIGDLESTDEEDYFKDPEPLPKEKAITPKVKQSSKSKSSKASRSKEEDTFSDFAKIETLKAKKSVPTIPKKIKKESISPLPPSETFSEFDSVDSLKSKKSLSIPKKQVKVESSSSAVDSFLEFEKVDLSKSKKSSSSSKKHHIKKEVSSPEPEPGQHAKITSERKSSHDKKQSHESKNKRSVLEKEKKPVYEKTESSSDKKPIKEKVQQQQPPKKQKSSRDDKKYNRKRSTSSLSSDTDIDSDLDTTAEKVPSLKVKQEEPQANDEEEGELPSSSDDVDPYEVARILGIKGSPQNTSSLSDSRLSRTSRDQKSEKKNKHKISRSDVDQPSDNTARDKHSKSQSSHSEHHGDADCSASSSQAPLRYSEPLNDSKLPKSPKSPKEEPSTGHTHHRSASSELSDIKTEEQTPESSSAIPISEMSSEHLKFLFNVYNKLYQLQKSDDRSTITEIMNIVSAGHMNRPNFNVTDAGVTFDLVNCDLETLRTIDNVLSA